jgi:predicted nucleotidyltransferase
MKSEDLLKIKNKLKNLINDKDHLDVILFGSYIKGKESVGDIDILLLTNKAVKKEYSGFHLTIISPEELFIKFPLMMNTILKEGYSLKHNKKVSDYFRFSNKVMFSYELSEMNSSTKVKIVNILRGKNKSTGMVKENEGEWIANGVFIVEPDKSWLFEQFFINFKIKFKRMFILMH